MVVMHIDVNSAFLSWTAVDMLAKGYPVDIRTIPSAIGGDQESRHGVILAKSTPAKKYNVVTGESLMEARRKCPNLALFPPDHKLYSRCSDALYGILKEYSPTIQRFSIDECFMEYVNCFGRYSDPEECAYELKDRIKNELGFTVNIGVGTNKITAKMAGELKKPDMVHTLLTHEELEGKLWPLDVGDLFMVGRQSAAKLRKVNIMTIGDLAKTDPLVLKTLLKSQGQLIWNYANGIDDDPITPNEETSPKSIGNSMTLSCDVTDKDEARKFFLALTDKVTSRLRAHGYKACSVSIVLKTNTFVSYSHQTKLAFFTDSTSIIYEAVCNLFDECWKGEPIRLLGVSVSDFGEGESYQMSLFEGLGGRPPIGTAASVAGKRIVKETGQNVVMNVAKEETADKTIDEIRKKFGENAIYRGNSQNFHQR